MYVNKEKLTIGIDPKVKKQAFINAKKHERTSLSVLIERLLIRYDDECKKVFISKKTHNV